MFMIFLWISPKIFAFSVNFMVLVCTGVLGIFFYTLYMNPILIHSPHFQALAKSRKCVFIFVIGVSFIVGVNFNRLLYSSICGTARTTNDFNVHYFFVKPLNNLANFNVFFLFIQIILCAVCVWIFTMNQEAWTIAVMGLVLNLTLIIFQIVKCF